MARLARLHLAEGEADQLSLDLAHILAYVDRLPDPGSGTDPDSNPAAGPDSDPGSDSGNDRPSEEGMPLRDDAVVDGLSRDQALREAPGAVPPFFHVPPVMGKD